MLYKYFTGGWLFLVPYFGVYAMYACFGWSVHPSSPEKNPSVVSLLEVFWWMHGLNAVLLVFFIVQVLVNKRPHRQHCIRHNQVHREESNTHVMGKPVSDEIYDSQSGSSTTVSSRHGWLVFGSLAILFWLPGLYLEYPADTWAHFQRIHEWQWLEAVKDHHIWHRSGHFLIYSLINTTNDLDATLLLLRIYYTAACLLLCWQYYLLGRAVGLGQRASLMFVLIQVLLLGNNIFSFYRYYGFSSTLLAQIGAIAAIRLVINSTGRGVSIGIGSFPPQGGITWRNILTNITWRKTLSVGILLLCAVFLMAINHIQSLGIALCGIGAIVLWRMARVSWWIVLLMAIGVAIVSFLVVFRFPHHENMEVLFGYGKMISWYGFMVFAPATDAYERMMAILGWLGIMNLLAGVYLLLRNHLVGWMTVLPILVMVVPMTAIPLASLLSTNAVHGINVFHRFFFAIPPGLAIVVLAIRTISYVSNQHHLAKKGSRVWKFLDGLKTNGPFWLVLTGLALFSTLSPSSPYFNRFWHAGMLVSSDFTMRQVQESMAIMPAFFVDSGISVTPAILSNSGVMLLTPHINRDNFLAGQRAPLLWREPRADLLAEWRHTVLRRSLSRDPPVVFLIHPCHMSSAYSLAGLLSGHWLPQEAHLNLAGYTEDRKLLEPFDYEIHYPTQHMMLAIPRMSLLR